LTRAGHHAAVRVPGVHGILGEPSARQVPAAAARPPARLLCLEWRKRLPGYGRTGTPVNDVEDYRLVVD